MSACGGGSSSSGGGAGSRTYQQGYAAGTVDTLNIVLEDLQALQTSLAGSAAPAQTSRGTLGRSFALLEPRQRETLAASLLTFIRRVTEARDAAAAAGAGQAEAAAAQAAADEALRALQVVVAADTAAEVSGSETARTAAVAALNQIAQVDAAAPDAAARVDQALRAAVRAAEAEVARLQQALDEALAQQGQQQGDSASLIESLQQQVASLRAGLTAAQNSLADAGARMRGVKPGFGRLTTSSVGQAATVTFHRRTADELDPATYLTFDTSTSDEGASATNVFKPHGFTRFGGDWYSQQGDYTFTGGVHGDGTWTYARNAYAPPAGGLDLTPDPVLYTSGARAVVAAAPNTGHFRARGSVYRGSLRVVPTPSSDPTNYVESSTPGTRVTASLAAAPTVEANVRHQRLLIQGRSVQAGTAAGSVWANSVQVPRATFRYDADDGLTMGFGGDGVIFADLERYQAKACAAQQLNCNNAVTADIEISFGAPDFDPAGQEMFHWSVDVVSPRLGTDGMAAAAPAGRDHGQYRLLLSNSAGAGRRLSYAAYGLFSFRDNLYRPGNPFYGRMQTFHYGLEAFADESGRRVSEMDRISATFRGRTHGWLVSALHSIPRNQGWTVDEPHQVGALTRMRGDVTLTANIGGSESDTISGVISNLRHSPAADLEGPAGSGVPWTAGGLPERVELQGAYANGVIGVAPSAASTDADTVAAGLGIARGALAAAAAVAADGSFKGTVVPAGERAGNWERGEHEGALYGPTGALEAAGTWWLQAARNDYRDYEGIIGSFGAVCTADCN